MALMPRSDQTQKKLGMGRQTSDEAPKPLPVADTPASAALRRENAALLRNFDALITRYSKPLYNFVYQWIGDPEEAADLVQDTFVSAYKAREQFRGDSKIYTWLCRIAHNHCKNRFKQRDRQREVEGPSLDAGLDGTEGDDGPATRDVADWSYAPATHLEQSELRAQIDRAVNALAWEYREVLLLRVVEDMSYQDIADVTGLTMEAVKTRLNRARAMVRQRVEPYYKT